MKSALGLVFLLALIGCGSNSNPDHGGGPSGCAEKLDLSSASRAASSSWRVGHVCSLTEGQVEKLVP